MLSPLGVRKLYKIRPFTKEPHLIRNINILFVSGLLLSSRRNLFSRCLNNIGKLTFFEETMFRSAKKLQLNAETLLKNFC